MADQTPETPEALAERILDECAYCDESGVLRRAQRVRKLLPPPAAQKEPHGR